MIPLRSGTQPSTAPQGVNGGMAGLALNQSANLNNHLLSQALNSSLTGGSLAGAGESHHPTGSSLMSSSQNLGNGVAGGQGSISAQSSKKNPSKLRATGGAATSQGIANQGGFF